MIPGLMQDVPLLTTAILTHAETAHGRVEIVSRTVEGRVHRYDYAGMAARARKLARALQGLGVKSGDRIASLAWNTHRHLELFYAVPGLGAVLNTVNPRLFDDQIVYVLEHAESTVLFYDRTFAPLVDLGLGRFAAVWGDTLLVIDGDTNTWTLRAVHHHRCIPAIKSANTTFHYFIARKFWLVFWGDCVDVISGAKLGNSDVLLLCSAKKGEH